MNSVRTISEIYEVVGQVVVDVMVHILTSPSNATKYPLSRNSDLVKSIDYEVGFQQRDIKTGRFETLKLSFFMEEHGIYLDKGRQGTDKNINVRTQWKNNRVTGVPIDALIKFIKKRGLQSKIRNKRPGQKGRFLSINQIAYILQNSIKKNGINPRNFINPALAEGDKVLQFYLDRRLLDILTKDLFNDNLVIT